MSPVIAKKKPRLIVPSLSACLQAKRQTIVSYLSKICTTSSDLYWYRKSPLKKAVTLVCHIDTHFGDSEKVWDYKSLAYVTKKVQRRVFFDRKQQVFVGPDGLGADDRAGFFGILRVYSALPDDLKPNLLFCDEEETGGRGAQSAAASLKELGSSLMLIELDRRGINDCVFYNDEQREYVDYIESFGFKKAFGSFSDISTIGRRFNICSSNLSVGYFDEHTRHETLYCRFLSDTIEKTIAMVADATKAGKEWRLPEKKKVTTWQRGGNWGDQYAGCPLWVQRALEANEAKPYTKEELERYPYLAEALRMGKTH